MRKITDFTEKDWNIKAIKAMSFKQFHEKMNGWAEKTTVKDGKGRPYRETILVKEGSESVEKEVDVVAIATIAKPSETEIASVWKKLTGKDVKSLN